MCVYVWLRACIGVRMSKTYVGVSRCKCMGLCVFNHDTWLDLQLPHLTYGCINLCMTFALVWKKLHAKHFSLELISIEHGHKTACQQKIRQLVLSLTEIKVKTLDSIWQTDDNTDSRHLLQQFRIRIWVWHFVRSLVWAYDILTESSLFFFFFEIIITKWYQSSKNSPS